ncbi:MAG: beta family protein [Thioalkalivibrio sp.]|nr:beta family protein [Thioalkalivibrio sp.]
MAEQAQYVPCLRWKQGEYQAVMRLAPEVQTRLLPLIEIPEIGYDFENRAPACSLDDHVEPFPKRVARKWGKGRCLVDVDLVNVPGAMMRDGAHPATYVFSDLRQLGVNAVPVLRLSKESSSQVPLIEAVQASGLGACVRLNLVEAASATVGERVGALLAQLRAKPSDCDLVLDLEAPNFEPLDAFAELISQTLIDLPELSSWRTLTLLGTSFPSTMAEVGRGLNRVDRKEWPLYLEVRRAIIERSGRVLQFGDYAIAHPAVIQVDFRNVAPAASVRYTTDKQWLIAKGRSTRREPPEQFRELCRMIVDSPEFDGRSFSKGDGYVADCATGQGSTGNLTTWRWVGTNRHITKVTRTLASLIWT